MDPSALAGFILVVLCASLAFFIWLVVGGQGDGISNRIWEFVWKVIVLSLLIIFILGFLGVVVFYFT